MRSAAMGVLCFFLVLLLPKLVDSQAQSSSSGADVTAARKLMDQGHFRNAAAAFQAVLDREASPEAYAGLIQSLLKLDDVKAAEQHSLQALTALPKAAATHAARGDVLFRRGLIPEADEEYRTALKLDPNSARGWLGEGKIADAQSRRRLAKENIAKAHDLDPADGDALYEWAIRQPYPANTTGLEKHLSGFHSDPEIERHEQEYLALLKALAGRKVWILDPEVDHAELKLSLMLDSALQRRGYGLRVTLNDHASALLLLDTGSSGMTITRKLAEKIGSEKLSDQLLQGVGKAGAPGYQALVDKINVGDLHFHDCLIHVVPELAIEADGIIGADIFEKFLVSADLPARKLHLEPLFAATSEDQRSVPDGFSEAYGFGHMLLLPAKAGDKAAGLFVLDSGSNVSTVSNELGSQVGEMRQLNSRTYGVGGVSNAVYIANNVTLRFAGMRKTDQLLITADLHSVSKNLGTELSGQIGFATMENLKLTIDYRDGLVKLEQKK